MVDQFSKLYPYFRQSINALNDELAQNGILNPNDPDLIWLLHSFAFLDARTQNDIQDLKDFYSAFIINALHPELVSNSPTVMIVEFEGAASIPQGSEILCRDKKLGNIKGWTVFDLEAKEIRIAEIKCLGSSMQVEFTKPILKTIMYIESAEVMMSLLSGDRNIYDAEDGHCIGQIKIPDWGQVVELKNNVYYLIYEYCINPKRFHFIEIELHQNSSKIVLSLEFLVQDKIILRLNCVPITNLSKEKSEGIAINVEQTKYELQNTRDILLVTGLNLYNPKNGSVIKLTSDQYYIEGKAISIKNNGMIYADLICINEFNEVTEVFSRSGNLVGTILHQSARSTRMDLDNKWAVIDLMLMNNLSKNTDLMALVGKAMKFFGQINEFKSIKCESDYKIAESKQAWRGVVSQNTVEISINNCSDFITALVWGKTFGLINPLNSDIKIRIISEKSVAVFDDM